MRWTVTVKPVASADKQECQAELGRMARGDGRCGNPATYRLASGEFVSHACGHHLRAELDAIGRAAARAKKSKAAQ